MSKVYWSFGEFIKSSSFRTISTLGISNIDKAKAKMSRLGKFAKTWIRKFYLLNVICKDLRPITYNWEVLIKKAFRNKNMCCA